MKKFVLVAIDQHSSEWLDFCLAYTTYLNDYMELPFIAIYELHKLSNKQFIECLEQFRFGLQEQLLIMRITSCMEKKQLATLDISSYIQRTEKIN